MDTKSRRLSAFIAFFLAACTFIVFWQVQHYGFIRFDEEVYLTKNPHVIDGLTIEGLRYAFTSIEAGFWHPLTWLSLMVDCQLFGNNAGGYHLTNLLFHLANTLLLFFIFLRMTHSPWQSGFVAALFALHPLHVESVAWVAARKDVLSTFFWMLTMGAYVLYVERPNLGLYLLTFFLFTVGLMAKPMLVTLPFVLLLLDHWPLNSIDGKREQKGGASKISRLPDGSGGSQAATLFLLLEKIPFIIMGLIAGIITIFAEAQVGALPSLSFIPLDIRLANALTSCLSYLAKTFWPVKLAVFYPYPGHVPLTQAATVSLILLCISLTVLKEAKRRPYLAVGWLWYIVTLLPVSGLIQVGSHAMADRYTYIPLIGIFIMLSWGVPELLQGRRRRGIILFLCAGVALLFMMILSWHQVSYWQNSETLYSHAASVTSGNYLAHSNWGVALMDKGDVDGAAYHYLQALEVKPDYGIAHNNLGNALVVKGDYVKAKWHFKEAIRNVPNYGRAHRNFGDLLMRTGEVDEAIFHYRRALFLLGDDPELLNNMGVALACKGKIAEAISQFQRALSLKPDFTEAKTNLTKMMHQKTP
jgi:protein O-mannosyl-transferase